MGTSIQRPASWRSAAVRHLNKLKTDGGRISQTHFRADGAFVSHSIKSYVERLTWPPPPEAQLRKTLTPLPKLQSSTLPTAKHQPTAKLHPLQMDPYCKVVSLRSNTTPQRTTPRTTHTTLPGTFVSYEAEILHIFGKYNSFF